MSNVTPDVYVREFHETYGATINHTPTLEISEADAALRVRLIGEEALEHREATDDGDLVEIVDALGDLIYVAYGDAITRGVDMGPVLAEIHRSNMSKLGADGLPIYDAGGKVLKGPDYFEPDIARVLREQGWRDPNHNQDEEQG